MYEALSIDRKFTALVEIHLEELDDESFSDWEKFEYWCENTQHDLMWKLIDEEIYCDIYEGCTPKEYFKSKIDVKGKIISVLCSKDAEDVMSVEIESDNKRLCLIYSANTDGWALGHCDSVLVVKSLDELTPESGFYPQT
jgi:hypothetical protein